MTDHAVLAANRSIGRRVLLELWGEGRLDVADELYAPDYVDHVTRGPEPEVVRGPEGIKEAVTLFRTAFPDLTYAIDEEMAERDLVLTRFSAGGTHGPVPRRGSDRTAGHLHGCRPEPHRRRADYRILGALRRPGSAPAGRSAPRPP